MAKRAKLAEESGGAYFSAPTTVERFSSGCTLLDCVLGGGWAVGRIANIVGDKSTGKTLLAIEACANFVRSYPDGKIFYAEAESAFDESYAESLGLPLASVAFEEVFTVEDVFESMGAKLKQSVPSLYVVDSLDALSDRAELQRPMDQGTFGAGKAKQLSQLFRRLVQGIENSKATVIIISQVRDNIGVTFGKSVTRSGGRALDFYASQALWLANIGKLKKTKKGIERTVGIRVRANCEKNKVGLPMRQCDLPLIFTFGIEDVVAGVEWLLEVKRHDELFESEETAKKFVARLDRLSAAEYLEEKVKVAEAVKRVWAEVEQEFQPPRRKYQA